MSFYEALGDGRFASTPHTRGPWDPAFQHAGPPAALLGRALERCEPRDGMLLARLTFEILRPVPVGEVDVAARVVRPGRSVQLLEAEWTCLDAATAIAPGGAGLASSVLSDEGGGSPGERSRCSSCRGEPRRPLDPANVNCAG
jgi:hypothetical protein